MCGCTATRNHDSRTCDCRCHRTQRTIDRILREWEVRRYAQDRERRAARLRVN